MYEAATDRDVSGDLVRRVNAWPHVRVERRGGQATIHGGPDDAAVAVLQLDTGNLIVRLSADVLETVRDLHPLWRATTSGVIVDLRAPDGPAAAEALLRWRVELELFDAQALASSP